MNEDSVTADGPFITLIIQSMEIEKVWFDGEHLFIQLITGAIIGQPLNRFSRLQNASQEQRQQFQIGRFKDSIHWEAIDEDLSL